ncbi:unnamed protein product, partial [Effrenium voratum]
MVAMTKSITTKLCKIEVPKVVLGKEDDPSLPVPPVCTWKQCLELPVPTKRLAFPVPPNSEPGCLLRIPLKGAQADGDGDSASLGLTLPQRPRQMWRRGATAFPGKSVFPFEGEEESQRVGFFSRSAWTCPPLHASVFRNLRPGDAAVALQRDGAWRVMRQPKHLAFLVPDSAKEGTALRPQLPDGTFLHFEVPAGVAPKHLVELQHVQGIWGLQRVVELTEVQREPAQSQTLTGPFKTALELLKSHVGAMQA